MDNYFFQFIVVLLLCKIGIAVGVDKSFCNYILILSAGVLLTLQVIDFAKAIRDN